MKGAVVSQHSGQVTLLAPLRIRKMIPAKIRLGLASLRPVGLGEFGFRIPG